MCLTHLLEKKESWRCEGREGGRKECCVSHRQGWEGGREGGREGLHSTYL